MKLGGFGQRSLELVRKSIMGQVLSTFGLKEMTLGNEIVQD
jgi:hypothetical protein